MSSLQIRNAIKGSIAIGKGEQGPVGPQGPIGDNNVCIGLSPTSEAEIWFDANDEDYSDVIVTQSEIKDFKENIVAENLAFKNEIDHSINSYKTDVDSSITSFKNNINSSITSFKSEVNTNAENFKNEIKENQDTFIKNVNKDFNTNVENFKNEIKEGQENFIETVNKDIFEDSKIDFFGKEHDKLNTRLNADFDNVHQRINESELIPYEGTNIKADNSYYGLQRDTVIKGRTLQSVIAGENKIIDASNSTSRTLNFQANLLKINTVYTFIFNIKRNTLTKPLRTPSSQGEFLPPANTFVKPGQTGIVKTVVTTTETIKPNIKLSTDIFSEIESGTQVIEFDIMAFEGDYTQTPLEELPFIEGIESTGDKSKNLFFGAFEEGQINNETGEEIAYNGRCRSVQYTNIEPNKTYTVSMTQNVVSAPWTSVRLYKDNTYIKTVQGSSGKAKFTFESGEANRLRVTANIPYNDVISCQIEEGETATQYEAYYDGYKISGKSCGKNLIKNNNYSCTFPTNVHSGQTEFSLIEKNIKVKPNTTYCFTYSELDNPLGHIKLITSENPINSLKHSGAYSERVREIGGHKGTKITTLENENYITLTTGNWDCNTQNYFNVVGLQLEESTSTTPYEPYKESNYSYILNEPLRSLPNGVCDTIDLETGVLTRRVGKVVLDGSENWRNGNNSNENFNDFRLGMNGLINKNRENGICDTLIYGSKNGSWIGKEEAIVLYTHASISELIVSIPVSKSNNLDTFKQWLQANPTTIYYELYEPTMEQLTSQQLKSFDTTTHIISDNKLMPIVSTKIPSNVQAIISTLKLENSDLKNNVEVLTVENEELKETNDVQDEMIDINMLASDELYTLIEPLLVDMLNERGVSKLVDMYVAMVQRGLKTLDEVPTRYREQVREILEALEK